MASLLGTICLVLVSYALGWHCRSLKADTDERYDKPESES